MVAWGFGVGRVPPAEAVCKAVAFRCDFGEVVS